MATISEQDPSCKPLTGKLRYNIKLATGVYDHGCEMKETEPG